MADDHAAHAIGCYGSRINKTPSLDRLAAQGMRFTNCFVTNSICGPSRATILTGKYSHKNGFSNNGHVFDGSQVTVPKLLQKAGYQTAMIGKWHLKSDPTGFDYWNVLPGQGAYYDPAFIEMGKRTKHKGYVTDLTTDFAIQYLKSRRDPDKPFFLMCHHKAPHRRWEPGPKHRNLYDGIEIPEPVTFNDDYGNRASPAGLTEMTVAKHFSKRDLKGVAPANLSDQERKKWNYQRYIKDYLRCVASVDDNVGRLLDYLEETGLAKNTIVIYTSDQGFFLGDHGWYDKRFIYEESLRMPFIVRYPDHIGAGTVNDEVVLNLDFAETFLDFCGVEIPKEMQGRSMRPLLEGNKVSDWRESMYYRYYEYPAVHSVHRHYGVRTKRHKLIHFNQLDEWELFDLERDPHEMHSVYDDPKYAEVVARLKKELVRLQGKYEDDGTVWNPLLDKIKDIQLELVLRYDFGESRGKDWEIRDLSGKGHTGTLAGGSFVEGRRGTALKIGGKDHIQIPEKPRSLNPAYKPLTVGGWCRPEAESGVVIAMGGDSQGFSLMLQKGVPSFTLRSSRKRFRVAASQKVELGKWVHLAAVLDKESRVHLYVNGKRVASKKARYLSNQPFDFLTIGADTGSAVTKNPPYFQGLLEDIRLYWGCLGERELKRWAGR